jgi:hypothetical protein
LCWKGKSRGAAHGQKQGCTVEAHAGQWKPDNSHQTAGTVSRRLRKHNRTLGFQRKERKVVRDT